MTDRNQIITLATAVGAAVKFGTDGRVYRVLWDGECYGTGCLSSLLCFAERARRQLAPAA